MNTRTPILLLAGLLAGGAFAAETTPYGTASFVPTPERPVGYRGDGSGIFPGAMPPVPLEVDEAAGKGIVWKTPMPSWSHSQPIAIGRKVICSAEPRTTLCVDADTGKILWQDTLNAPPSEPMPEKYGTWTWHYWGGDGYGAPCSDGERIFKCWSGGKKTPAQAVCYDLAGKRLWAVEDKGSYSLPPEQGQKRGRSMSYGIKGASSPALFGDLLVYPTNGGVLARDKRTGEVRWKNVSCANTRTYETAVQVATVSGRKVLVLYNGDLYDPKDGQLLGTALPGVKPARFERGEGLKLSRIECSIGESGGFVSPIVVPDQPGVIVFGILDWSAFGRKDGKATAPTPTDEYPQELSRGTTAAGYRALAVRLSFGADGKLVAEQLWKEPATVPYAEQGPYLSYYQGLVYWMAVVGSAMAVIDLKTGEVLAPQKPVYPTSRAPKKEAFETPEVKAAMETPLKMTQGLACDGNGIPRGGNWTYARGFIDGRGRMWINHRWGGLFGLQLGKDWKVAAQGQVAVPPCWCAHAHMFPHGERIYLRSWSHLYCLGKK
jgi:hypothetical protein